MIDFIADFVMNDNSRPDIQKKPWMEKVRMELVTPETLDHVFSVLMKAPEVAVDFETEGLDKRVFKDRTQDQIVGICLAPSTKQGYYLPLRHKEGAHANLSIVEVTKRMRELFKRTVAIFHNSWFDQEFAEFCGGEPMATFDDPSRWHDTWILAYLEDSRSRSLGLKYLSKEKLGLEMIELEDLFPNDYKGPLDFSLLDPTREECVWYGCSDAICTFGLKEYFYPRVICPDNPQQGQGTIYVLEKMCVPATRWMQRNRIFIDPDKVRYLVRIGQQEFRDTLELMYKNASETLGRDLRPGWVKIFFQNFVADDPELDVRTQIDDARKHASRLRMDALDETGKYAPVVKEHGTFRLKYDLLSRQQFGLMMREAQIPGLRKTAKSGQVLTADSEIERLSRQVGDKFPFLAQMSRLATLQKALGTYLISLLKDVAHDGTMSIRFKQLGTDTGRFTTPSPRTDDEKKATGGASYPFHGTPASYDTSKPECLLRIREAFAARPGKIMAAIDFAGVELRIATSIAHEDNWIKEYFRCGTCGWELPRPEKGEPPAHPPDFCPKCGGDKIGDLHTSTAMAFFGENGPEKYGPKEWKQKRQIGKRSNFLLIYGGSARGLQAVIPEASEEECQRYHLAFVKKNPKLYRWWQWVREYGKKHGYVKTRLGRKYPIPDIRLPTSPRQVENEEERQKNRKLKAKAERNATNGPIQGASADITKLAMAKIYLYVRQKGWEGKVLMTGTIHDELLFEIDEDIFVEAIEAFQRIMTRSNTILKMKMPVPLTTDCEIGDNWSVPYDIKEFRNRRVRRDGVQVDEKGRPTKKVWPARYVALFGPAYGYADDVSVEEPQTELPKEETSTKEETPTPAGKVVITVLRPTLDLASSLAEILAECPGNLPVDIDLQERSIHSVLAVDAHLLRSKMSSLEAQGTVHVQWPTKS